MLSYSMILSKQSFNKLGRVLQGASLPNLLIHQVQFNHNYFFESPAYFSNEAARFIPTHPHGDTNLVSGAEKLVTYINPKAGAKLFGTTSPVSVFRGTREQMIENTIIMYLNCLVCAYVAHQQAMNYVAKGTNNSEVLTRSSFAEFSGNPGRFDGPFTGQEGQYILKRVVEEYEKIVDPLDRNFVFTPTLAMAQTVDTRDGEKNVAYNAFFSIGRGIGPDFPTCIGSPQAPNVQIVSFAKKNISDLDLVYMGTQPYMSSPDATPLFQGNALIHPGITTGGNLLIHANEICRDHSMRYARQEFTKYVGNWASTDPYSFIHWMNNPIIYHDISASSVAPDPNSLLSTTFALTDQKSNLRGVYPLAMLEDFYMKNGQRPSEVNNKADAEEWDDKLNRRLEAYRQEVISENPVPEKYGQSGLTTTASDYKPIQAPNLSPVALRIAEEVQQQNQAVLEQAKRDMYGETKPGSPSSDVRRDPDSGPSTPGLGKS